MSENIGPMSSGDASATSSSAALALKKPFADTFRVYEILERAGSTLKKADSALDITLPLPLPNLPQLISAILPVLSSSTIAAGLSVSVAHKISAKGRAFLRSVAMEMREEMLQEVDTSASQIARPIYSSQTLTNTDLPKPLTPEQRQRLKGNFEDTFSDNGRAPEPHLALPVSQEDRCLPTVKANLRFMPVDEGDNDPVKYVLDAACLWDTGSTYTIVSDDLLSHKLLTFPREDPANEPYRHKTGTTGGPVLKIQVSAIVTMSNKKVQLDTIALVVPLKTIPNQRSGVIIGQRTAIDRVVYLSIPRSIMAEEGRDPGEEYWGVFEVLKFLNVDGELVNV